MNTDLKAVASILPSLTLVVSYKIHSGQLIYIHAKTTKHNLQNYILFNMQSTLQDVSICNFLQRWWL